MDVKPKSIHLKVDIPRVLLHVPEIPLYTACNFPVIHPDVFHLNDQNRLTRRVYSVYLGNDK